MGAWPVGHFPDTASIAFSDDQFILRLFRLLDNWESEFGARPNTKDDWMQKSEVRKSIVIDKMAVSGCDKQTYLSAPSPLRAASSVTCRSVA